MLALDPVVVKSRRGGRAPRTSRAYADRIVNGHHDRPTDPRDLRGLARDSEREFEAASSDIRPLMPLHAVPWLIMTLDQVKTMPLDSRAGLVLSLVDGRSTIEMILDVSGIREDEAIGILARMLELGVIELHGAV